MPEFTLRCDLSGQVAIVTGASQGLGKACAVVLAANGAKVACVARNVEKLTEVVSEITADGGEAEAIACAVTNSENVDAAIQAVVDKWGGLHILVNNAGITRDTLFPGMSDEQWDDVIDTNLRGAFLFARAASRHMMRARYGRIINMSSVTGLFGNKGQANYAASKAGLIGMTRCISRELAKRNITANAVCPGFIESDMTKALGEALLGEVRKMLPAQRLGTAEDVAACVLFLASREASYITGQTLVCDGGMIG